MPTNLTPLNKKTISLREAAQMTKRYRQLRDKILLPEYRGKNVLSISETFKKESIAKLLSNPEVKALRVYHGMSEDLLIHSIIVGVNDKNEDMLPSQKKVGATVVTSALANSINNSTNDMIIPDDGRCPPDCSPESPINLPIDPTEPDILPTEVQ